MTNDYWGELEYETAWVAETPSGLIYGTENIETLDLTILKFGLKYRSHEEWLPPAPQYYYTKGILCYIGSPSVQLRNIGYYHDGHMYIKSYRCPELLVIEEEVRPWKINQP